MNLIYYFDVLVRKIIIQNPGNLNLSQSYIGVIGTIIAILFTILITIVANYSARYPSNFTQKLSNDPLTWIFYSFLVLLIIIQMFLFHNQISKWYLDLIFIIVLFGSIFCYWRYILNFITPMKTIKKLDKKKELTGGELKNIGDYVRIGIEQNNDELAQTALTTLKEFHRKLK